MDSQDKGEFCQHKQVFSLNSYLGHMFVIEHKKRFCPIFQENVRQLEINSECVTLYQDINNQIKHKGRRILYVRLSQKAKQGILMMQSNKGQRNRKDDNVCYIVQGKNEGQAIMID
ncbi:unnamed protein product (macronuclear) [Paramecium tetraurelia]|uniref:Uncharacterized protein n=1 Tax=Paramecium tetraurelia TaxID=5888 RepID=A0CN44_PARTE|nr:uncharacterized protein GSPATT00008652001 [Paramecium tetraurelia]CAK72211.1 unnamed protein product [Paramecium tetraurelia]|eukprot:XP_001439608.1 hypothetical protein (macronuclear) [Paramecium tetraurelia strain d4-2]